MGKRTNKPITTALQCDSRKDVGLNATDTKGLYLNIAAGGSKSWIFRFQISGRRREMGLGSYPRIGLAEARVKATAAAAEVEQGIDPLELRSATRAQEKVIAVKATLEGTTLRQAIADYVEVKGATWRSGKHRQQWQQTMVYNFEDHLDMPIAGITAETVEQVLGKIWTTRTETADRLLGRICNVVDYAMAKKWRKDDSTGWEKLIRAVLPSVPPKDKRLRNHSAMAYVEMPDFWKSLCERTGTAAIALRFLILTGGRSSEIRGARAREFDLDAGLWIVPADRMKAGREHRVTLSRQAVAIVRPILDNLAPDDLVFEGSKKNTPMHDATLTRVIGDRDASVHGFRSSFRDWVGEETDFDGIAAELCLAHRVGTAVEKAYRRGDMLEKRRVILQAWADYLEGLAKS